MKFAFCSYFRELWSVLIFLTAISGALQSAEPPATVVQVGVIQPFHGILHAKDFRLWTLSIGSSRRVTLVMALDAASRLLREDRPASFAEFQVGDAITGFVFPDQFGRQVVAVASAHGHSSIARDHHPRRARSPKTRTDKIGPPKVTKTPKEKPRNKDLGPPEQKRDAPLRSRSRPMN